MRRDPTRDEALRQCRRGVAIALAVVATSAVASLPGELLGWPWLCALLAPAAVFGLLPHPPRRPLVRSFAAVAAQLAAVWLAHQTAGPLLRPAVLAGSILPPLAFVVARRLDADATLGLFLSFCVLLVGTILHRAELWLIGPFVLAATLQLRCEARRRALEAASPRALPAALGRARATYSTAIALGALCALAATSVERSLALLPERDERQLPTADDRDSRGRRTIGLPDNFVLDGGGELLDLQGELLLEVTALDGGSVGDDLYLRSGFFERPGLDSWSVGKLAAAPRDTREREWLLRRPSGGAPLRRFEILRYLGARNFVFVPPGLCAIRGLGGLHGDPLREWFRLPQQVEEDIYQVAFQQLPDPPANAPVDARWRSLGLLELPPEIDLGHFRPLLRGVDLRGGPLEVAGRIAAVLQQRCRYERREPTGPYGHSLLNFLHGERIGFCMHFASSAAILLRIAGVPCRIGVGLYGGQPSSRDELRHYGSQHAHAWVEIPITGRGFVVFDPTPPGDRGRSEADTTAATQPEAGPEPMPEEPSATTIALERLLALLQTPWPYLAILLLALASQGGWRRNGAATAFGPQVPRPARRLLLRILRELAQRGYARMPADTLEVFEARLRAIGVAMPALQGAFTAYQEIRFGGRAFDDARQEMLQAGLLAARGLPRREGS